LTAHILNERDYRTIERTRGVGLSAPLAQVIGLTEANGEKFQGEVIATSGDLPELLNQKISYGSFFGANEEDNYAVIGPRVAERLFKENVPMGKTFELRGETFVVRGILDEVPTAGPLALDVDYNNAILIPYKVGQELMGGAISIQQVLVKPKSDSTIKGVAGRIRDSLRNSHGDQEDFTVLTQDETLLVAGSLLNMLTTMIAGIAAISLFVGGIGIMNIMFVSVTERTSEIGIRKAVGATNGQILNQFLTEATILSLAGGLAGVLISVAVNFILRVTTNLQPVITLPIMGVAVAVAILVGAIFGVAPAYRAARKDPIEALRYE
jgi:ABC-type antimicrobial peptide transport system permease subunit